MTKEESRLKGPFYAGKKIKFDLELANSMELKPWQQDLFAIIESIKNGYVIVVMWQILGLGVIIEGFGLNNLNLGWGVDRPNPFQPPGGHLRYPPVYDLFSPRRI